MFIDDNLKIATLPISLAAAGVLGTAPLTVDIVSSFNVTYTGAVNGIVTLPTPTQAIAGDLVKIANVGATAFTVGDVIVTSGTHTYAHWTGTAWNTAATTSYANVRFGTTVPTVLPTDNENDTYVRTSDGTSTGSVISTFVFDKNTNVWVQQSGSEEIVDVAVTTMPTFPTTTIAGATFVPNTPATTGVTYAVTDGTTVQYAKWNGTQYISAPTPLTCPAPMTRAALIALRNAGGLNTNCDYVITDHVQGRLVSGTTIHLQAVSSNELSENVSVNTTYDNEAWRGIYDIDRALVLELQDNRNNIARGFNGNEVANFDWGNTAYTNVLVDNSTLTVTYGATAKITNVEIKKLSNVNLTGFIGQLLNSTIDIVSILNLTNANGIWIYFEMKDNSTLNASNYTGGGDNYYNTLAGVSNVNFSNRTTQAVLRQTELFSSSINAGSATAITTINNVLLHGSSTITHSPTAGALTVNGGTEIESGSFVDHQTGTLVLSNSRVAESSTVRQNTNAGTTSHVRLNLSGASVITNSSASALNTISLLARASNVTIQSGSVGNTQLNSTELIEGSSITKAATSTATLSIANSHIGTGSGVIHSSASPTTITRVRMGGASTIQLLAGSGGNSTIADVDMFGNASINKYGTSTTGNLSLSGGIELNSSSFIYHQGTGNLSVAQANLDGISGINVISGNRNYAFTRISMTGVGRANLSGTNAAVTDSIQDTTIDDRGVLTISCSGLANSLLYSRIAGLSGGIQFSGTTGSKSLNRIKCNDGSINMNNNPNAGTYQLWNISDAGVANISGHPAGTGMSYVDISNRGTLTVNKTGVGAVSDVRITQAGAMSVTGATTAVNRVNIEIGNINISAGSLQNVDKKMGGTLTVNGGNQNNVFHWTNVNKTTTVNNTNRVDYLGLTSTLPIL